MEVDKNSFPKQTLHLSSVAYVFIFSNYSYEDSSRFTRDSLQICTEKQLLLCGTDYLEESKYNNLNFFGK